MMDNARRRTLLGALLLVAALGMCLVVCFGCAQPFVIGTASDDAVKITAKNETGQAVTAVAAKGSFAQDFPEALAQNGDWAEGAAAELYIKRADIEVTEQEEAATDGSEVSAETDIIIEPRTDIQLTTADGMTYVLHQLNIDDIKDATVMIEDGTAYLVYASISSGEEVNTLDAELAYQEQVRAEEEARQAAEEEAQRLAEEEARRAAEEQAAAEAAAAEAAATQSASRSASKSSSEPASTQSAPSAQPSGGAVSGGEDACVDDLILN